MKLSWKMLKNFLVFFFLPAILVDEKMPHEAGYDSFLSGFGKQYNFLLTMPVVVQIAGIPTFERTVIKRTEPKRAQLLEGQI